MSAEESSTPLTDIFNKLDRDKNGKIEEREFFEGFSGNEEVDYWGNPCIDYKTIIKKTAITG